MGLQSRAPTKPTGATNPIAPTTKKHRSLGKKLRCFSYLYMPAFSKKGNENGKQIRKKHPFYITSVVTYVLEVGHEIIVGYIVELTVLSEGPWRFVSGIYDAK